MCDTPGPVNDIRPRLQSSAGWTSEVSRWRATGCNSATGWPGSPLAAHRTGAVCSPRQLSRRARSLVDVWYAWPHCLWYCCDFAALLQKGQSTGQLLLFRFGMQFYAASARVTRWERRSASDLRGLLGIGLWTDEQFRSPVFRSGSSIKIVNSMSTRKQFEINGRRTVS